MNKKVISIILSLSLIISVFPLTVFADGKGTVNGTVRYCAGHTDNSHDYETDFTYSDDYFSAGSYEFRYDLAVCSFALALSAFSSVDAGILNQDINFISFAQQCGFGNIVSNEWYKKPATCNSIGVCCASKELSSGCTLIAVGIRGNNYGREWGGNFVMGTEGEHEGFATCREQVLAFLSDYIASQHITGKIKLWMSGYSRGAATANMTAAKLDLGYSLSNGVSLAPEDIYCYTFEAPMGAQKEETLNPVFDNIKNIINSNDIVVYCCFENWGFSRYGIDYYLPDSSMDGYAELKDEMLKVFSETPNTGGAYSLDDFRYIGTDLCDDGSRISQREFYPMLVDALLTDFASSREEYVRDIQDDLSEVLAFVLNIPNCDFSVVLTEFAQKLEDNWQDIMKLSKGHGAQAALNIALLIEDMLIESFRISGLTLFDTQQMNTAIYSLASKFVGFAVKHPDLVATVLANAVTIIKPHFPEYTISWLKTLPEDFLGNSNAASATKTVVHNPMFTSVFSVSDKLTALFEKVIQLLPLIKL